VKKSLETTVLRDSAFSGLPSGETTYKRCMQHLCVCVYIYIYISSLNVVPTRKN
jgi:hypothetical protein